MSILGFDVRFLPLVVAVSGGWYSRNQRRAVLVSQQFWNLLADEEMRDLIESHPSPFLPPEGFGESIKRLFSLLHTKLISGLVETCFVWAAS
ncbi:hypothetical protein ISN45_Aa06g038690 [Arabidopsis thaliana x Arabidopsis arenosa]|uniref:Uncharacterized protein n=1 Tax=Arabidopsis thaliana x Arabidopsis arenosa TaxID=1240361 RepID=A0A8T1Z3E6_9BRAS|nr:hypothetical protein ISN45_Aa06g038690 [Arabidopsis thaliana x Arabidopsis arenosa]